MEAEWTATLAVLLNGVFFRHEARLAGDEAAGLRLYHQHVQRRGRHRRPGTPRLLQRPSSAVVGLTKNVAAEVCGYGVRVNAIAPYSVATSMVADAYLHDHTAIDETMKMLADESPLVNRPGLATDVANAALWLASDESGYTTGHTR